MRDDGPLAEREQQRHDGLQPVRVLRYPDVQRLRGRAHRDVRTDHVQAERRGTRPLRRRRRVLRPSQGPGHHHRHHDRRQVTGPRHVAHTQHAGHEQLSARQRLLHVQQADGNGRQAENVGDQHGAVQAGRQPGHVRHIQATAAREPWLTRSPIAQSLLPILPV